MPKSLAGVFVPTSWMVDTEADTETLEEGIAASVAGEEGTNAGGLEDFDKERGKEVGVVAPEVVKADGNISP